MTHIIEDHKLKELLAAAKEEGRREALGDVEPIAEVVSKHGDPESFGEREIKTRADLSKIPYRTKLYTAPPRAMLMRVAKDVIQTVMVKYGSYEGHKQEREIRSIDLSSIVSRIA